MTNFEKVTASPEALGEFLAALSVATGPWDKDFYKAFCEGCGKSDCGACPHEKERNNPLWWLMMGAKQGEVLGLSINIKAAFPVLWGREYYTVAEKIKDMLTIEEASKYFRIGENELRKLAEKNSTSG